MVLADALRKLRYEFSDSGDADSAYILDAFIGLANRIHAAEDFTIGVEEAVDYVLGED